MSTSSSSSGLLVGTKGTRASPLKAFQHIVPSRMAVLRPPAEELREMEDLFVNSVFVVRASHERKMKQELKSSNRMRKAVGALNKLFRQYPHIKILRALENLQSFNDESNVRTPVDMLPPVCHANHIVKAIFDPRRLHDKLFFEVRASDLPADLPLCLYVHSKTESKVWTTDNAETLSSFVLLAIKRTDSSLQPQITVLVCTRSSREICNLVDAFLSDRQHFHAVAVVVQSSLQSSESCSQGGRGSVTCRLIDVRDLLTETGEFYKSLRDPSTWDVLPATIEQADVGIRAASVSGLEADVDAKPVRSTTAKTEGRTPMFHLPCGAGDRHIDEFFEDMASDSIASSPFSLPALYNSDLVGEDDRHLCQTLAEGSSAIQELFSS